MAGIDIHHSHQLPPPRARQAVQDVADKLVDRFGVDCSWDEDVLSFSRTGVDGRITLLPDAVRVQAQLGFLLAAMQDPIEAEIRRVLDTHLA